MKTGFLTVMLAGLFAAGCAYEEERGPLRSAYHYPLLSSGTMFASLPPAVQRTLRAETGGAPLEEVVKTSAPGAPGKTVYQIYFENDLLFPPLYVAADGSVLNPDGSVAIGAPGEIGGVLTGQGKTGIGLNDLPPQVVKAIQRHAPESEIRSITQETQAGRIIYGVSFKDQKQPPLYFAEDGSMVSGPAQIELPRRRY